MKKRTAIKIINNFLRANDRAIRLRKSGQMLCPDRYLNYTHRYNQLWRKVFIENDKKLKAIMDKKIEAFRKARKDIIDVLYE